MAKKVKKRKEIKRKLLHKYRLVILNESTFEEKISFKLSRLNVFVTGSLCTIGLIALTTLLIAFTPLREYIPGYSSTKLKKQATDLTYKTDSLVASLHNTNRYLESIRMVLRGDVASQEVNLDSLRERFKIDPSSIDLTPIKEDSLLRAEVALEDKYNLFERNATGAEIELFPPLSGEISNAYDPEKQHYAVDVTAPKDTPIKAVANGTVIFSEWTADTGYVIILEHKDGLISVYKHNGSLNKRQGEVVRAGEVIASVGNTGEFTTGPHLHFELWSNGNAVNPLDYIDF
ncbi:M23 family metallopeptidase [Zobellia galactanivorans]|uniref:Metallopeptidase, family M23 n=1 Tax=Zobellia galactanivorans (strain DSM 12802 / CCUG 47099 / CIP 106680 / NCIMB 13871 / Dsij) TaxID=63186 RepID=G0L4V2_ZOBGA|nr:MULTISPECIES: M23 family metallopeptidase [Zobellia]MBU3026697.1 M23 family metallopeptidase [Zobellia galactanivorans]MDO6809155.1 M23 family metallopeptidase [Zobellia galactanivorans]OWW26805.1 peptidase M23 [Zobellia sp. OII3]CAZ95782.1 Metallopeptidase, family M23 [Zobellia galactanivorans]